MFFGTFSSSLLRDLCCALLFALIGKQTMKEPTEEELSTSSSEILPDESDYDPVLQSHEVTAPLIPGSPIAIRPRLKWRILVLVTLFAFVPPLTNSTYGPAYNELKEHFNATDVEMSWTFASYSGGIALTPLLWGPLSDRVSRRYVLGGTLLLYSGATIFASNADLSIRQELNSIFSILFSHICHDSSKRTPR